MVLAEYSEKQDGFKEKPLSRVRGTRLGLGGTGSTRADWGTGVAKAYSPLEIHLKRPALTVR